MIPSTASGTEERTALKEWAVLIDAMARGAFSAMIRKGGLREQRKGFAVRHDRFLMYPTFFHEKTDELAPSVKEQMSAAHEKKPSDATISLEYVARVHAVWHVTQLELLRRIEGEHGLAWKAVESRFHYKDNPGVHVIAVELMALPQPVIVPETKRYLGCVSWVELDEAVDLSGATPTRTAEETDATLRRLHAALGDPTTGDRS